MSRLISIAAAGVLAAVFAAVLSSCRTAPAADDQSSPRVAEQALPDGFVARYNESIAQLDRLWARTVVRVDAPGPDGDRERTQGEGYLQLIQPRSVSLSVGKYIDRMYFVLGSNDERYWWFDMLDTDAKTALVGRHELVTPELAGELGVPVHPLDLVDLLGLSPVSDDAQLVRTGSRDGRQTLVVATSTRLGGTRELEIDPGQLIPLSVRLLDPAGEPVASSELSRHRAARVNTGRLAIVAGRAEIDLPTLDATITLDVSDAENLGRKPRQAPFRLESLLERAYRIDRVVDLDDAEVRAEIERLRQP